MGLHPYKVCGAEDTKTVFLAPSTSEERLPLPHSTELVEAAFISEPRPRNATAFRRIWFILNRLYRIISFSSVSLFLMLTRRFDIVHIHSPMFWPIAFYAWVLRKRVCITFHGTDFHRIKASRLYRMGAFVFDQVFIISPDMREVLVAVHGEDKIVNTYNGVDTDFFNDKDLSREKKIIAVGSLKDEKGFKYLIEAYALMTKQGSQFSDYKLILVGEGALRESLEELASQLGVENEVSLIGHKGQEELLALYNESEIFVLSSVSEGFPKVLLEAMACGCKVVVTKVGCVESILPSYRFVVCPANAEQLASSLESCIASFDEDVDRDILRSVITKHSWDKVQTQYSDKYKGLL
nr:MULTISPECIES: glycosyltransferase family 4 protein [unclassified Marinobacterium]